LTAQLTMIGHPCWLPFKKLSALFVTCVCKTWQ
jgi:hypothetical protein